MACHKPHSMLYHNFCNSVKGLALQLAAGFPIAQKGAKGVKRLVYRASCSITVAPVLMGLMKTAFTNGLALRHKQVELPEMPQSTSEQCAIVLSVTAQCRRIRGNNSSCRPWHNIAHRTYIAWGKQACHARMPAAYTAWHCTRHRDYPQQAHCATHDSTEMHGMCSWLAWFGLGMHGTTWHTHLHWCLQWRSTAP